MRKPRTKNDLDNDPRINGVEKYSTIDTFLEEHESREDKKTPTSG